MYKNYPAETWRKGVHQVPHVQLVSDRSRNLMAKYVRFSRFLLIHPIQYLFVVVLIVISLPVILGSIHLIAHAFLSFLGRPQFLAWNDLFGEHASRWIKPLVRSLDFIDGVPIEFQTEWLPLALVIFGLVLGTLFTLKRLFAENIAENIAKTSRINALQGLLRRTLSLKIGEDCSALAHSLCETSFLFSPLFQRVFIDSLANALILLVLICWLALLDTQLFFLLLAIVVPAYILAKSLERPLNGLKVERIRSHRELFLTVLEKMKGWQTIQTFRAVPWELERYNIFSDKQLRLLRRSTRALTATNHLIEWVQTVAVIAAIILALRRLSEDAVSGHVLAVFFLTMFIIVGLVRGIKRKLSTITNELEKINGLYNSTKNSYQKEIIGEHSPARERITSLKFVSAIWNGDNNPDKATKSLTLELALGDFFVLIDKSHERMAELIHILLGIKKLRAGQFLINHRESTPEDYFALAQDVAYISSENLIISAHILDNVSYPQFLAEPSPEDCKRIGEILSLVELEKNLFFVTEYLSSEERIKLMIARALYQNATLWIIAEKNQIESQKLISLLGKIRDHLHDKIVIQVTDEMPKEVIASQVFDLTN